MPRAIGNILSAGKATLTELQTTLGTRDAYRLLEVIAIDAENIARVGEAKK